jgi:uncharacterized protein
VTTERHLLYLDTSAMIRLYSDEPGRDEVLSQQAQAGGVVAHVITYVELRGGLAGRHNRQLLSRPDYTRAVTAFELDWPSFAHVGVNDLLLKTAGDLAADQGLKAYDAVHLAAAQTLAPLGLLFMTFDRKLQRVADDVLPGQVWHG